MKNLFNQFRENGRNQNFAGNWLYFAGTPKGPSGPEDKEGIDKEINKALKSPLGFGVKELRLLEENEDQMNAYQKRRFRNIAGYQLSLTRGKDIEDLPPRMLTYLASSSLSKLLPKRMQNQIAAEIDSQMQNLGSILNKNEWSTFELSKVSVLYRRLQKNAILKDGSRKDLFEKARKKIVEKAFQLMTKSISTGDETYDVINQKDKKVMTLEEKLLVMEIRRMFPNEKSWAEKSRFYDWDRMAVESIATLLKDPKKLHNPNLAFTWELLREFLGTPSGSESVERLRQQILTTVGKDDLEKHFKSTEAIKFLQFAKNSRVFLPTHLQALQEIMNDDFEVVPIKDLQEWVDFSDENEDLKELENKLQKLDDKRLRVERYGLQYYLDASEGERKKILEEWRTSGIVDLNKVKATKENYEKLLDSKKGIVDGVWDNDFNKWVKNLEDAWEDAKTKKLEDLDLERVKSEIEIQKVTDETKKNELLANNKKRFDDKEEKIKTGIPNEIKDFLSKKLSIGSDLKSREKFINKFRDFATEIGGDLKKNEKYSEYEESFKKYNNDISSWRQQAQNLYGKVPIISSQVDARKKINEKYNKLKEKVTEETKNLDAYKTWQHFLKNPKKVAEESKDAFISNIDSRIRNKNLYAADFEILWGDEVNNPQNPYYEDVSKFREKLAEVPNKEKLNEFRQKFAGILNTIFEDTALPEVQYLKDGEDKFAPWYSKLDDALSYDNIIARLAEEGFDLRKEFSSPQQITQLIDGAILSYRDRIFDIATRDATEGLGSEEVNKLYAGWDRLHGGLDAGVNPTKIHEQHVAYEQNKLKTSEEIENAHQVNDAYVWNLRKKAAQETDPAKKAHYEEEANKLAESFKYRKYAYQQGGNFWGKDENGKDKLFWAPGKEFLNELHLQTQSVTNEISEITNGLRDDIAKIAENFRGISKTKEDPIGASVRQAEAKNELDKLLEKWPNLKDKLAGKFANLGTIINEVVPEGVAPDQFTNVLMKVPMKMLDSFQKTFDDLGKYARKIDYKFAGDEAFWKVFADNFIKLETSLNFQDGKFAKESESLDKYLEESNKALEFLTKLQFFDDNTSEKDEFTKNYDEIAKGFKKNFAEYKEAVNEVDRRLRRDLNKLNEQEFFDKYGLDKEYMEELLNNHKRTAEKFNEISGKFLKPSFLKDWIQRYDASPQDRAEAIAEMADFNSLRDHAKNAGDYAKNIKKWVTEYDDVSQKNGKQRNYQRFSLYDLYAIVKQAIEVHERRWQRDSERAVANIGMSFFGENSAWGKDFKQKAEEAEENRVKEFETQYGEVPGWDLQDALYRTNDADEAKALIRLMLDKGFLQWDDPGLWRTLMRLSGNAVVFRDPEDRNLTREEILNKVRNACEFIWSKETFRDWDTNLAGKLKSAIESHAADFDRYEDAPGARTKILADMLKKWKRGDSTDVDPAKYECFIRESFNKGKMNGQPDQRWYFMVMGVATINPNTGKSLISRDVFMRMNSEFLVRFPHVDFLTDKKESWKLNGRIVPEGTPGAELRGWSYDDYLAWGEFMSDGNGSFDIANNETIKEQTKKFFYHIVHASPSARDRVSRMDRFSDKEGDHDDAESFFADWKQVHIVNNMSQSSGGENKLSNDLWRRYLSGFPTYMKMMREYIKEGDSKWGDMAGWQKEKTRALFEIGDRLNAALTVTQTLQGNINLGQSRGSLVFNAEEWRKEETGYSASAKKHKNEINSFMKAVFAKAGGDDGLGEVLDEMGVLKYGVEYKEREKKLKESGIWDKSKKLLDSAESRQKYFENTEIIEKVLMEWTPPE